MKIALRLALVAVACVVLYGAYTAYETLTGDLLATGSGPSAGDAGATAPGAPSPIAAAPMAAAPGPSAPTTSSPGGYAPPPSRSAVVPETSRGIAEDPGTPPKIQSVSPPAGSAQGGERVVIKGESFARPQVLFGNSPAQVVEATPDALTVVVPAPERGGAVALVVTNRSGGYAVRPNAYTYASR
jgi:IPT/TIG domain-containing protein